MQALLQSAADGTEKPRYRAACDACRQSKVRCSGNGVCVRCKKHDYKCRYSIAHRAGKPKGSKNKATLKKLENLQAGQGNNGTPSSSSRGKAVAQQRKRKKNIPSHHIRARYDAGNSLQNQSRNISHVMARKYAFSSPAIVYTSPTSPGREPCLWEDARATDIGSYGSLEASYGHMSVSTLAQYMTSPREGPAAAAAFKVRAAGAPQLVGVCSCLDRLALIQKQLYNLDLDLTLWRFDSTVDLVTTSLSSCHIFLNCAACPKHAGNLSFIVALLDHTFDVLNRLLVHRTNRNSNNSNNSSSSGIWTDHHQHQYYHAVVQYDYTLALQDCILEQAVSTSYQIVNSLKEIVETEIVVNSSNSSPPLSLDRHHHHHHHHNINDRLLSSASSSTSTSTSDFSSPASGVDLPTTTRIQSGSYKERIGAPDHIIIPAEENDYDQTMSTRFQQQTTRTPFECAAPRTATIVKSTTIIGLGSVDINHLLQVIHRYETIVRNLQALVTRNAAAAAASASVSAQQVPSSSSSSWSIGFSEQQQQQQQQQQHRKFNSYDVIGMS